MEFEEPVEVQRRFRSEGIDVHPTDSALVVFYEVEASVVSSQNEELLGESNRCQKIIRVPSLSRKTNIAALARQIIKKCRYLHPEMQPEIENSLEYLRQRNKLGGKKSKSAEQERKFLDEEPTDMVASLNDLDEYMEMMYEDINSKVKGSKLILQLARNPNNLEEIGAQTSLMKMLTRTMREDGLKSTPLLTNIVSIFFFFSSYSTFHPMLVQYKVGSTCLKIVAQVEQYMTNSQQSKHTHTHTQWPTGSCTNICYFSCSRVQITEASSHFTPNIQSHVTHRSCARDLSAGC
eukprot:m.86462 g.86462  ORF g.86462 m.86462 type:complete len:292 (+) comp12811_c0_seq1:111-986(+)